MAPTAAKKSSRPGPRPRGPFEDKRKTLTTRITDRTRKRLDKAAQATGRSLSQEIEFRLEQSFEGDEALGGRQLRALFGLLGNAAVLIEEQTGKPYFKDWSTWVAVQAAWRHLISAFRPNWPEEHRATAIEFMAAPLPKRPVPPPLLKPMGQGSLKESIEGEKARKDYEAALAIFEKENAEKEGTDAALRRIIGDEYAQKTLGKNVAVSLLPEKPKKEG